MKLVTYLHDPDSLYVPLLENIDLPKKVKKTVVTISPSTTAETRKRVKELGFKEIQGGLYGTARINAVRYALKNSNEDYFFICDFDKLIHWINNNREELEKLLEFTPNADFTAVARSARAFATYPETWVQTELIATRILTKIIKKNIDFMNGPFILSRKAAETIEMNAKETGVGSCVEFCLLAHQANLSIDNLEVDGLTWEDPDRYLELIKKSKSFDDWKYDTYHSLYEWRKRVEYLNAQVQIMIRLTEEPINPKYPSVHNKTFEVSNK